MAREMIEAEAAERGNVLRDQVYSHLCEQIRCGEFSPGEKLTIRTLAREQGISPTPVREALYRLISEGILEGEANRSARIPLLTTEQVAELREIRLLLECRAAEKSASNGSAELATRLRDITSQLTAARRADNRKKDLALVYKFQVTLFSACGMPHLLRMIDSLWLKTGPYLNLLFPDYVASTAKARGEWRERIAVGIEKRDPAMVRREVERDIGDALGYIGNVVAAAALLHRAGR